MSVTAGPPRVESVQGRRRPSPLRGSDTVRATRHRRASGATGRGARLLAALAFTALLAAPASAQDEIDRQVDPGEGRADPAPRGTQAPPPGSAVEPLPGPRPPDASGQPVPDQGRRGGAFIPE